MPGVRFETRVYGLMEQVRRLLRGQTEITKWVRTFSLKAAERSLTKLRQYPPRRLNSPYRRTFTLRSGWRVSSFSPFGGRSVSNSVPYTQYVQGDSAGEMQAWMHRGRWNVARTVVEAEVEKQREALLEKLRKL